MKKMVCVFVLCASALYAAKKDASVPSIQKSSTMIDIGIKESQSKEIAHQLNILLSNEYVLYTKTQKYHWNVQGPFFGPLHDLFGKQYEQLAIFIDTVAERIRALGYFPAGTLSEFTSMATLQETPGKNPDDKTMIKNLLDDHESIIKQLRTIVDLTSSHNEMGTNNMLSDMLEKHEKIAWMLRAHVS